MIKLGRTTRAQPTAAMTGGALLPASSNDGHELDVALQSPQKKPRLKKHVSTTYSDEEDKTLPEIIKQCSEAATAGRIYSIDKANTHTLHFWANAVTSALTKNSGEKQEDTFSGVKENFGKLLTKLLLSCDCYERLSQVDQLYKRLEEKGVMISLLAAPLRKLMAYKTEHE